MSSYPGADQGQNPNSDPGQAHPYQPLPPDYGGPSQSAYPPAPPVKSGRGGLIRTAIVLGIVIAIVAAFFLFRDRLSNEVTSLQVGECFDQPQAETEVSEVQRQPCNEPHDAEVIAVLVHPAPPTEGYPVVSGFDDYIEENCIPAFDSYTGRSFQTDTELALRYFRPTLTGWGGGDRGFTCYVARADESKLTVSVRSGPQATAAP